MISYISLEHPDASPTPAPKKKEKKTQLIILSEGTQHHKGQVDHFSFSFFFIESQSEIVNLGFKPSFNW